MIVRPVSGGKRSGRSGDDVNISPEERQAIARAKLESMKDVRKDAPRDVIAPATKAQDSLISFDDPVPQQGVQASQNTQFMSSVTLDPSFGSPTTESQPYNTSQTNPAPYANYALPPAPAPVAPAYSNYTLPPAPAAPQFQQYQQYQSGPPQYSQPPLPSTNAVPLQYPSAPVTGVSQSQPNNGYPPTAPTWNSAASPAPATSQQLVVNTSTSSNQAYAGSTPHSQASYGSAPSFAQPPRQQSGQYGF